MNSDPPEPGRRISQPVSTAKKQRGFAQIMGWIMLPVAIGIFALSTATQNIATIDITQPQMLVVIILLMAVVMVINAIFVAGEVALDLLRISFAYEAENPEAQSNELNFSLDRKESVVAACVLGAQTGRAWLILLSLLAAPSISVLLDYEFVNGQFSRNFTQIFVVAMVISIPIMFINVIVDLVAKNYATRHPMAAATKLASVLRFFDIVFRLPALAATKIATILTKNNGPTPSFATDTSRAEEEIKEILDSSEGTGEIEESERELLQSVFEFGDKTAINIMTPRVDIEAVPVQIPLTEIAKLVESTGHSRFPVFDGSDDIIVGIIHAKDVLQALSLGEIQKPLKDLMRPAHAVTESKALHDLLAFMRSHQAQMVIVQDEYGGTAGLVTMEDIVEELVGDIVDEYDTADSEFFTNGNYHLVSGKFHLDELNDELGTEFESEEFDTLGGFLFGLFGRQPKIEEYLEHDGFRFTVQESDGRRIQKVKIEKIEPSNDLAESF